MNPIVRESLKIPGEVQSVPVIHPSVQVLGSLLEHFGIHVNILQRPRWCRRLGAAKTLLAMDGRGGWHGANILGIGSPFAFGNFDRDETRQALLLARSADGGEFAADGHGWWRDGVLDGGAGAESGFHGMQVVVVPPASRVVCVFSR